MRSMSSVFGVGGFVGALLTGVFAAPELGGNCVYDDVLNKVGDYSISGQLLSQVEGVGLTALWSGLVSIAGYELVDRLVGFRVHVEQEREGLDLASHGESAYHA